MSKLDEFRSLCLAAKLACETIGSTFQFEPYLLAVLRLIKDDPIHWPEFKLYFVEMLSNPDLGPWELIAFCMRELQWPELLRGAQAQLEAATDFRVKSVMAKIVSVYETEWEDADLYRYYAGKQLG